MRTAIVHHPVFEKHDTGPGHPEKAERYATVMNALRGDAELWQAALEIEATEVARGYVQACHSPQHFKHVEQVVRDGSGFLDSDTVVSVHSLEAALRGAGAACQAIDALMDGRADNAFVPVRPPGHHATPDRAMGFCVFNNVAIGAAWLLAHGRANRIAILDYDVHHGNGSQTLLAGLHPGFARFRCVLGGSARIPEAINRRRVYALDALRSKARKRPV